MHSSRRSLSTRAVRPPSFPSADLPEVEPARDSPHGSGASLNLRAARWGIKEGWEPGLLAAAHALSLRLEELLQVLSLGEPRRMAGGAAVLEVGPVIGRSDDPAQHAGDPCGEGQGPFPLPRSPFPFTVPPHTPFRHTAPPAWLRACAW